MPATLVRSYGIKDRGLKERSCVHLLLPPKIGDGSAMVSGNSNTTEDDDFREDLRA